MASIITIPSTPQLATLPADQARPAGRITPARARKILEENGLQLTEDQAAAVTEFLYTLAKMTTHETK
jgi:hypothetical protein